MTLEQFKHLAETWGADIARWPRTMRAPARRLVEQSDEARLALGEARGLDAALALLDRAVSRRRAEDAAFGVLGRIAAAEMAAAAKPSWREMWLGWPLALGSFSLSAALGVALALVLLNISDPARDGAPLLTAILDAGNLSVTVQ